MSREIKFRAWDKKNKHMLYEGSNAINGGDIYTSKCMLFMMGSTAELMQYTELKDKNGKEIYEGDIIESKTTWHDAIIRARVIWDESKGMWKAEEINPDYNEREYLCEVCRPHHETVVIGNIHEHPNLLTTSTNS